MGGRGARGDDSGTAGAVDGRRSRWDEHRVQRRAAFVAAGAEAVDRHGPEASAEQIAEVAGVSRTVLYRYFRDREDLRQAIAEHVVRAVVDSVLPQLQVNPERTPHQIIGTAVGTIVGWLDEHPNLYLFLRSRRGGLESVENTLADNVAVLLKMLMAFFGIAGTEAELGAYGIVGFVETAGGWWLVNRPIRRDEFIDQVCNGVWHILEGTARNHGVIIEYDAPLPIDLLATQGADR